jgi:hypothetical protein
MTIIVGGLLSRLLLTGGLTTGLPLYLPYEYTSVLIAVGNVNPFDIDPEATTLIAVGNVNPFDIDPEATTLITVGNVNPFDIDPEATTLITVGLTTAD